MMVRKAKIRNKKITRRGESIPQAERADRYQLYQQSVQEVVSEVDFVDDTYRQIRGRRARSLREDFCGTGNTACEWVRRRKGNRAFGVDIDPDPLEWGRRHNLSPLPEGAAQRIELIQGDVREVELKPVDIVLAMNFSYWLFQERAAMRTYFEGVYRALAPGGVFFLDAYGGYDAPREIEETRECEGFTYIWEQADFDPVSAEMHCRIHFQFEDGSRMQDAFRYTWRLWTLPEIREMLDEAGFGEITVYWQGWTEDGEPDGVFVPVERGEADAGWICYLSAQREG